MDINDIVEIEQEQKKRKRIQVKDNKGPRYECFCLKKYLSYPALYLHLKKKHPFLTSNNKSCKQL
jgi:hypothetical protein